MNPWETPFSTVVLSFLIFNKSNIRGDGKTPNSPVLEYGCFQGYFNQAPLFHTHYASKTNYHECPTSSDRHHTEKKNP